MEIKAEIALMEKLKVRAYGKTEVKMTAERARVVMKISVEKGLGKGGWRARTELEKRSI